MELLLTSDLVTVIATVAVLYITQRLVRRYIRRRGYNLPPGPQGWPFIGYVGTTDHLFLFDHKDQYGDVSYMNILGMDIVVLNSITGIREALQGRTGEIFGARAESFHKKYGLAPMKDIIFRSMAEENWKPLRQLVHSLLKQYGEGITQLENTVSQELDVVILELDKRVAEPTDISNILYPSLVNTLSILSIGERCDYDHPIQKHAAEYFWITVNLFRLLNDVVLDTFPFLRHLPFGPGSLFAKYEKKKKLFFDYLYTRPKSLAEFEGEPRTGLVYDMFKKQKTMPWLTDDYIKGAIHNMFGAGFLTTNGSLRAFFLIMLHYPDVQHQIQKEIDDVIGTDRRPTISDRVDMPYTMAAILEVTRYTSVVPMSVPHVSTKDTTFRGFTVPRDCLIIPNLFRVHHDEELWENPWSFDPSRFLDTNGQLIPANHPKRVNLIPFGVGKRVCMGEVFAKTRMFLYITSVLQTFTLKPTEYLPSWDPRDMVPDYVLCPGPYQMIIHRRGDGQVG